MPTTQAIRKVAMVFLAGPIKHWWDENWETPEHWHYDDWREALSAGLVAARGYLVYRPHHAQKGDWTERAQVVNDAALAASDIIIDMTPPGIPSEGTVSEIKQASSHGTIIVQAPPPESNEDFDGAIRFLLGQLEALGAHRDMVDQEEVLECIGWQPGREWMVRALAQHYEGCIFRIHYQEDDGSTIVEDVTEMKVVDRTTLRFRDWIQTQRYFGLWRLFKVEVLNKQNPVIG